MTRSDAPVEASLARDGWALDDAEVRLIEGRSAYWLPDRADRIAIAPGDHAKLIFRIAPAPDTANGESHCEWMWVAVDAVAEGWWHGTLDNDPKEPGRTHYGMSVWFRPEHVIDILKPDGWRASEGEGILRCHTHGLSHTSYVCEHLAHGGAGLGFHTAERPWPVNPRPDAWCDQCQGVLQEVGSWEAAGDRHPKLAILCGGCYDACRRRNSTEGSDQGAA